MTKKVIIPLLAAMLLGTVMLSGCGGQQASESSAESSDTLVVEDSVDEVTLTEITDESSDIAESSGDASVYDSTYTVDQDGNVRDMFGMPVSQVDPETYEGSITYTSHEESSEDEGLNSDDFTYLIVDDEVDGDNIVKITKYNGSETDLVIPDTIDGRPVTILGDSAFKENKTIKSVTIPDTVKRIEDSVFYCCSNLSMISFGENSQLRTIYTDAFAGTVITEITIPKNCKTISDQVFSMCHELKSLTLLGMETNVSIDLWLPKECVVYGYENSIAHKKLFSLYGFTFKVIDE